MYSSITNCTGLTTCVLQRVLWCRYSKWGIQYGPPTTPYISVTTHAHHGIWDIYHTMGTCYVTCSHKDSVEALILRSHMGRSGVGTPNGVSNGTPNLEVHSISVYLLCVTCTISYGLSTYDMCAHTYTVCHRYYETSQNGSHA